MITAIAWNNQTITSSSSSSCATREILLGTNQGQIYETWIEPTDEYFKKELKYVTLVHTLKVDMTNAATSYMPPQQIVGIHFDTLSTTTFTTTNHHHHYPTYFIMVTTSSRLYQFIGQSSAHLNEDESSLFGSLFSKYSQFQELPGNIGWSKLCFYNPKRNKYSPNIFAWITGKNKKKERKI